MSTADIDASALLLAAERIEELADHLPVWRPGSNEPWYEFLDHQYQAEMALAARLRREPTCELWMCPTRTAIDLALAGFRVRCEQGLAAACRAWAKEVRKQMAALGAADLAGREPEAT